jgi:hypothetical protein
MARPKNEQTIIQEKEITQIESAKPKVSLAEKGIFFLYDTKVLDKQGRPTKIELKTFETAKNLLINNSYRYEAREASEFWEQNLTQTEKQVMTIKFRKAEMRNKEIELGNLKQTR